MLPLADTQNAASSAFDLPSIALNFTLGVVASIVASIIMLFLASFLSERFRWLITSILNALIRGDIEMIFPNTKDAQATLIADFKTTKRVWVLAGRGQEFSAGTFDPIFQRPKQVELLVLLPTTKVTAGMPDWTKKRVAEMNKCDPGSGDGIPHQIEANVTSLKARAEHGKVQLRRFNIPHIGRIILTDKFAYFTPYLSTRHGKDSPIYQFRRGGSFYESLKRLFVQVWEASSDEMSETKATT